MNQFQLLSVMKDLAANEAVLPPDGALEFLSSYLDRMRLTLDQSDYEGLLSAGVCILQLSHSQAWKNSHKAGD